MYFNVTNMMQRRHPSFHVVRQEITDKFFGFAQTQKNVGENPTKM